MSSSCGRYCIPYSRSNCVLISNSCYGSPPYYNVGFIVGLFSTEVTQGSATAVVRHCFPIVDSGISDRGLQHGADRARKLGPLVDLLASTGGNHTHSRRVPNMIRKGRRRRCPGRNAPKRMHRSPLDRLFIGRRRFCCARNCAGRALDAVALRRQSWFGCVCVA